MISERSGTWGISNNTREEQSGYYETNKIKEEKEEIQELKKEMKEKQLEINKTHLIE